MAAPETGAPGTREALQPAGLASRLLAAAVDVAVLAFCFTALHLGILALETVVLFSLPGRPIIRDLWTVAEVALVPVYNIAFWSLGGWTPGKWLLGLRVVTVEGRTPGLVRSVVRFAAYTLSIAPLLLGVVAIAFDPLRRAWHDRIARTLVVHARASPVRRARVRMA